MNPDVVERIRTGLSRTVLVCFILMPLLLGVVGGVYATRTMFAANPPQPNPDFAIATSPSSQTIAQGSHGTYLIDLSSLNDFAGSVNITASLSPTAPGATIEIIPNSISLLTGSAIAQMTVTVLSSVVKGTYQVNITATNRQLSHSVLASMIVSAPKDFAVDARASSMAMSPGAPSSSTITLTSVNGFSGNVTLVALVTHGTEVGPAPKATLSNNTVTLAPGEPQSAVLSLTLQNNPRSQSYTVTVIAMSGSTSHSILITATVPSSIALKQTPQN